MEGTKNLGTLIVDYALKVDCEEPVTFVLNAPLAVSCWK